MKRWKRIQIVVLAGAVGLAAWQFARHGRQSRTLAALEKQAGNKAQELESRKAALDELNKQRNALLEHRKASEDSVVVPLMRERAQAASARSTAEAAARAEKGRVYRRAMAAAMDDPEQRELNRQLLRNEIKLRLAPLVKQLNLSPGQADRLRDLLVEHELQKNDRTAALLRDSVSVADALRQRDAAHQELQRQLRALLGDAGYARYDEGNQSAQKANVERVLNWLRNNLGDHSLDARQSARLGELILAEFSNVITDDTDTFRPAQEVEQWMVDRQQNIIRQIAPLLTAEQLAALNNLAAEDRVGSQAQLDSRRRTYGLTSD